MRRVRVIPVLLIRDDALVKTRKFADPAYIGDPINAVRIFNDKEVDELLVLDTTLDRSRQEPPYELLEKLASECFMPLSFGGGIRTIQHVETLIRLGIEKLVIRSQALLDPGFVPLVAERFGSQSIIVAVDVRRTRFGQRKVVATNVEKNCDILEYCQTQEAAGAGELLLTAVDREGTMQGYDISLLRSVAPRTQIPVIANGGAGSVQHMAMAVCEGKASAVAAGSMFVFHKTRQAVMINFPSQETLAAELYAAC